MQAVHRIHLEKHPQASIRDLATSALYTGFLGNCDIDRSPFRMLHPDHCPLPPTKS